jgi:poly(3-hydroxybutyrate) depolymerase
MVTAAEGSDLRRLSLRAAVCILIAAATTFGATAKIADRSFYSSVFKETRNYRIFLPPDYDTSGKRSPVVYWFHGNSGRHNRHTRSDRNYDEGPSYDGDNIAAFVGTHDLIVVKVDGYNPRTPGEDYSRPWNVGPETDRQFPLFFPEIVRYIDATYRTIADREHRGTAGLSMGGFMSYWIAGKYPDLVSNASNFMGSSEFVVGPRGFPSEYRHEEMRNNYVGVLTRLVMGTQDFIQFYHRRMNLFWGYTRDHHETDVFDYDHGAPAWPRP